MTATIIILLLLALLIAAAATVGKAFVKTPVVVVSALAIPRWALVWVAPLVVVALLISALFYATGSPALGRRALEVAGYLGAGFVGVWAGTSIGRGAAKLLGF